MNFKRLGLLKSRFLAEAEALQKHYFLGLKILDMLVAEFNQPVPGRTLTQHRKMSVSFRDQSLYGIFELALTALRQLRNSQATDIALREQVWYSAVLLESWSIRKCQFLGFNLSSLIAPLRIGYNQISAQTMQLKQPPERPYHAAQAL